MGIFDAVIYDEVVTQRLDAVVGQRIPVSHNAPRFWTVLGIQANFVQVSRNDLDGDLATLKGVVHLDANPECGV